MKKDQPSPAEQPGQDESGKTSAPQSEQGLGSSQKADGRSQNPPKKAAKEKVADDDAADGV